MNLYNEFVDLSTMSKEDKRTACVICHLVIYILISIFFLSFNNYHINDYIIITFMEIDGLHKDRLTISIVK